MPPVKRHRSRVVSGIFNELLLPVPRRTAFYRLTHVMTELMDRAGIRYSAFAGTMLGCVRHQGMIPWDDDIDFIIPEEDVPLLHGVIDEVQRYGIKRNPTLADDPGIYQFLPFGPQIVGDQGGIMGLDVFVVRETHVRRVGAALHHRSDYFRRHYPKQWVLPEEVFPRRRYTFGPLQVWGMQDPTGYLERSGFALDLATVRVHRSRREAATAAVERLKAMDAYPLRSPEMLRMVAPYEQIDLLELDAYRLG